ncbi:hypothetical protein D3C79_388830 [compost metagenome]
MVYTTQSNAVRCRHYYKSCHLHQLIQVFSKFIRKNKVLNNIRAYHYGVFQNFIRYNETVRIQIDWNKNGIWQVFFYKGLIFWEVNTVYFSIFKGR